MSQASLYVGRAGWSLPRSVEAAFPHHGSALERYADRLTAHARRDMAVWCIFDNTVVGAAAANALELQRKVAV